MGTYGDKDEPSEMMKLATDLEKMRPLLWLAFNSAPKSREEPEDKAIGECDRVLAWLLPIDLQILREKVRSFVQGADSIEIECLRQAMNEVRSDIGPLLGARFSHREEWESYRILTSMIVDILDGIWKKQKGQ